MARLFVYDQREFPDPDPNLSVEDIKKMMSDFFPELANAEVKEQQSLGWMLVLFGLFLKRTM